MKYILYKKGVLLLMLCNSLFAATSTLGNIIVIHNSVQVKGF